ncbi:DUF3265 domain-containing protein [Vibrio parahaemolyticus]|nr:DUF3265 domain-containing protein [Vibrio parahaemolyticus]HCH1968079.1 DUF3265 domain-containing protein [Vibrio parahaemolyticus]
MESHHLTRRLRGIHAAWHFWYAVVFGGESGLRKLGLCGIHPLTQRYASRRKNEKFGSRYKSRSEEYF